MVLDPITSIRPGLPVHTLDGKRLGAVKEIRGNAFKVAARARPDYWLPCDRVLSYTIQRVTMDFPKNALDQHKRDEPPLP